nr:PAS domain S-box protein [uncultured Holophaga sp.]
MTRTLRLLVLEDTEADYLLALRLLEKEGFQIDAQRVDRQESLLRALDQDLWDAVLSDYSLPGLPFREALALIQGRNPNLPVVLFSGSVGEEEAVSLVKLGVKDFVLKDRPARLPSALQTAVRGSQALRSQMQTLQALAASEARFLATFEQAAVGIAQVTLDGRIINANQRLCEILGYEREELIGLSNRELSPPEENKITQAGIQKLVSGNGPSFTQEKPNIRKDGTPVWVSLSLSLVRNLKGAPDYLVAVVEDIQARKDAEARQRASEERFMAVFLASPFAILLSRHSDERVLDANPAFLELSGLPLSRVAGATLEALGFWANPMQLQRAREAIEVNGYLRNFEMAFQRSSGLPGTAMLSTEIIQLGGERFQMDLIQDVTEIRAARERQQQMEQELAHLQRIESVGRLAGGLSHDMNNVLGAILAMANLLQSQYAEDTALVRKADVIAQAAVRGRDLVKGLTDFARKEVQDPVPVDLNALVDQEASLLEHTTFKRVLIEVQHESPLPEIMGEPSALANVLMNLCVNACDAMPGGGRLRLGTHLARPDWVEITVEDSGEGMSPDVLARAMEPFFTTKPAGKGTGLGLSIVYGTVKAHGGTLDLRSTVGKGTRITLGFPALITQPVAVDLHEDAIIHAQQILRILLVDDDELIIRTLVPLLELMGHQVQTASGGLEALRRLEAGLQVDLAILDLNMPGIGGLETLHRLRIMLPELPVLVTSGFVEDDMAQKLRAIPKVAVLGKPFMMKDFEKQVALLSK